ncbi:MAG: serine hydrolase [Bacteroidota bacterium]|nr:serine hydrolase [Bacteroidota bacterium]
MKRILTAFVLIVGCMQVTAQKQTGDMELLQKIKTELGKQTGFFALAFEDLQTHQQLLWHADSEFHAASTMKTPVMIEVYKQVAAGKLSLQEPVLVTNQFKSIVDGSDYQLNPGDDSQEKLYSQLGSRIPLKELVYQMIIHSSNLATNIIMEMVDGKKVMQTMRELGAEKINVLRGVEDQKAFDAHLNNTTTAYDLMLIYSRMAEGRIVNKNACAEMIKILEDQTDNVVIPALLPSNVKVAHKTGFITGVHHDSGIVFLPDGRKYVLVLLSKNLADDGAATAAMAKVSEMLYQYVLSEK